MDKSQEGGPLILASASPRRRDLLAQAGIAFEVVPDHRAECVRQAGEAPGEFALRAAIAKARAVAAQRPGRLVLGADTVVALNGDVLGKPADAVEACAMLRRLAGRAHDVFTGLALARCGCDGRIAVEGRVTATKVWFRELADAEIEAYVASGEPLDKAGAYGIQGLGRSLVADYQGSYSNVVGLPLETLREMLASRNQQHCQ